MSLFWSITGGLVLVFGVFGSLLTGRIDTILIGGISSFIGAMACFTAAILLTRVKLITETLEAIAENKKNPNNG